MSVINIIIGCDHGGKTLNRILSIIKPRLSKKIDYKPKINALKSRDCSD